MNSRKQNWEGVWFRFLIECLMFSSGNASEKEDRGYGVCLNESCMFLCGGCVRSFVGNDDCSRRR